METNVATKYILVVAKLTVLLSLVRLPESYISISFEFHYDNETDESLLKIVFKTRLLHHETRPHRMSVIFSKF